MNARPERNLKLTSPSILFIRELGMSRRSDLEGPPQRMRLRFNQAEGAK
jgi:hypothetical protein